MKVLVSAYACEPDRGSEPGIGWRWTREIARRHATWLVTRENNVAAVRSAARAEGLAGLTVVGHDLPPWARWWKRGGRGALAYNWLWQIALGRLARRLDRAIGFDVVHHLTFASDWLPSGLATVGKPFVWGPVGRHERVPDRFLLGSDLVLRVAEPAKALVRGALATFDPTVRRTVHAADVILALGGELEHRLPRGHRERLVRMLACGADPRDARPHPTRDSERPGAFRVLFAGRLVDLKGVRLALEAFAHFAAHAPEAELELVGDGPRRRWLGRRARSLGLADRVHFSGHLDHGEALERMRAADVFLFPSFEGGGMVVPEAMAAGCPVVCLDRGGPAEMVGRTRGVAVPIGRGIDDTARSLAAALARMHDGLDERCALARRALGWLRAEASWDAKGARLDALYARAVNRHARSASLTAVPPARRAA